MKLNIQYIRENLSSTDEIIFNSKEVEKILLDDMKIKEVWKQVKIDGEYYDYDVSNKGNVRQHITHDPVKKFDINDGRYYYISLPNKDKKQRLIAVHRAMALSFLKIPKKYIKSGYDEKQLVVNHIDGYKKHNILYNIEWCTPKENMEHAIENDLFWQKGENSHLSTITNEDAHKICKFISEGKNNAYIMKEMSVSKKIVQHIRIREAWRHISKNYEFPKLADSVPYSYSDEFIHKICKSIEEGKLTDNEISKKFNISRKYVNDIRNHKRRTNISKNYNF